MIKHGVVLASPGYGVLSVGLRQAGSSSGGKTSDGDSPVTCMDLSSSGQLLAVGRFNGNISFYRIRSLGTIRGAVSVIDMRSGDKEAQNFELLYTHNEHQNSPITSLCWSRLASAQRLFSGCQNGSVYELDWRPTSAAFSAFPALHLQKPTTLVCSCAQSVARIEASVMDSSELGGLADLVVVSAERQTMLFQFPLDRSLTPRCRDISTPAAPKKRGVTRGGQDTSANYSATCFSNSIDGGGGITLASGMMTVGGAVTRGSVDQRCLQVQFLDADGNLQQVFELGSGGEESEAAAAEMEKERHPAFFSCRQLISLNTHAYKHLLIALSANNRLHLINLREMRSQSLGHAVGLFPREHCSCEVLAAAAGSGRIAVMVHTLAGAEGSSAGIVIEMFECMSPAVTTLPLRILPSPTHAALCRLQSRWRLRGKEEDPVMSLSRDRLLRSSEKASRAALRRREGGGVAQAAFLLVAMEAKRQQEEGVQQLRRLQHSDASVLQRMEGLLDVLGDAVTAADSEREQFEDKHQQGQREDFAPLDGHEEGKSGFGENEDEEEEQEEEESSRGDVEEKGRSSGEDSPPEADAAFLRALDRTISSSSKLLAQRDAEVGGADAVTTSPLPPSSPPPPLMMTMTMQPSGLLGDEDSINSLLAAADAIIAATDRALQSSGSSPALASSSALGSPSSPMAPTPLVAAGFSPATPMAGGFQAKSSSAGSARSVGSVGSVGEGEGEDEDLSFLRVCGGSWLDVWVDQCASPSTSATPPRQRGSSSVRARLSVHRLSSRRSSPALVLPEGLEHPPTRPCFCGAANTYHVELHAPRGIGLSLVTAAPVVFDDPQASRANGPDEPLTAMLESLPSPQGSSSSSSSSSASASASSKASSSTSAAAVPASASGASASATGGSLLVRGFYDLPGGEASPARLCGMIAVGDVLVGIDDLYLETPGVDGHELLGRADRSKPTVLLHFRYGDVPRWMQRDRCLRDEGIHDDDDAQQQRQPTKTRAAAQSSRQRRGLGPRQARGRGHELHASDDSLSPFALSSDEEEHEREQERQERNSGGEPHNVPFLQTVDEVLAAPVASAAAAVLPLLSDPLGLINTAGVPSALTLATGGVEPPHFEPLRRRPQPFPAATAASARAANRRAAHALRDVELFLGLHDSAPRMPAANGANGDSSALRRQHKYSLAAPVSLMTSGSGSGSGSCMPGSVEFLAALAVQVQRAGLVESGSAGAVGRGLGRIARLEPGAGFFLSDRFSRLFRSSHRGRPFSSSLSSSLRRPGAATTIRRNRASRLEAAEQQRRAMVAQQAREMAQACLLPLPALASTRLPFHPSASSAQAQAQAQCESPVPVQRSRPTEAEPPGQGGEGEINEKDNEKDEDEDEDGEWSLLHRRRHAEALLALVRLKQRGGGSEGNQMQGNFAEVAAGCVVEQLQQALEARGRVGSLGAGSRTEARALLRLHVPPPALTVQTALVLRLMAKAGSETDAGPPLQPVLGAWLALLSATDAAPALVLQQLHAHGAFAMQPPAALQALGYFTGTADEVRDHLLLVQSLATAACLARFCAPLLRLLPTEREAEAEAGAEKEKKRLWRVGALPLSIGPADSTFFEALEQGRRLRATEADEEEDRAAEAFVASYWPHLMHAPLLLALNCMGLARASAALVAAPLGSEDQQAAARLGEAVLLAAPHFLPPPLPEQSGQSSAGAQLLRHAAAASGLREDLVPLAVVQALPTLWQATSVPGPSVGAVVASACFPALQPWSVRATLPAASDEAALLFHDYLSLLLPGLDPHVLGQERQEWLLLSLQLGKAAAAEEILSRHLPVSPEQALLSAARCCVEGDRGFVNAALAGCRRLLRARVDGGCDEDSTGLGEVLRLCLEQSLALASAAEDNGAHTRAVACVQLLWVLHSSLPSSTAAEVLDAAFETAIGTVTLAPARCFRVLSAALGIELALRLLPSLPCLSCLTVGDVNTIF